MRNFLLAYILLIIPLAAFSINNNKVQSSQNYDNIEYLGYDYYIVEKNHKYGVIYDDELIIEPQFDKIEKIFQENEYIIVEKKGKKGLYRGNVMISPTIYNEIKNIKTNNENVCIFILKEGEKYGAYTDCLFSNQYGDYHVRKISVPIEYDEVTFYQQNSQKNNIFAMGFFVKTNNKKGYYDIQMGKILPPKYSSIVTVDYDDNIILALKTVLFFFDVTVTEKIFDTKINSDNNSFWSVINPVCWFYTDRCKAKNTEKIITETTPQEQSEL